MCSDTVVLDLDLVFPTIFGGTVALSPIYIPFIMCSDDNVQNDTQPTLNENGQPVINPDNGSVVQKGPCQITGRGLLVGLVLDKLVCIQRHNIQGD